MCFGIVLSVCWVCLLGGESVFFMLLWLFVVFVGIVNVYLFYCCSGVMVVDYVFIVLLGVVKIFIDLL